MTDFMPHILQVVSGLGYPVFVNGDYNLNIIGVRSPERVANAFDDSLCVAYKVDGHWVCDWYEITTDPGSPYLKRPINSSGCAILAPGSYRGAYGIAKHRGKYDALCQINRPVTVYRDDNKDTLLDMDDDSKQTGMFGINVHKRDGDSDSVNGASAGCQVFRFADAFDKFMRTCRQQVNVRGFKTFTYTLIDQGDL